MKTLVDRPLFSFPSHVHIVELEIQLATAGVPQNELLFNVEVGVPVSIDDSEITRFEDYDTCQQALPEQGAFSYPCLARGC